MSPAPGQHFLRLTSGGRQRRALLHVPAGGTRGPAPLMLVFHGTGTTGGYMVGFTGLSAAADRHGFLVAYPTGTGLTGSALTWNAGGCCGDAMRQGVDDVAFSRELVDHVAALAPVDRRRVYAVGMSNGAMLCHRLGIDASDRFAAIATVGGPLVCEPAAPPTRAVPVCHMHGTEDEFAPYAGGVGRRSISRTNFRSVESTIAFWVERNGCDPAGITARPPIRVPDGTSVIRREHRGQSPDQRVVLYTIEGMGHTWPGREAMFPPLGKSTKNLDASEEIWRFLSEHTLP